MSVIDNALTHSLDIDKLENIARAATPGEWHASPGYAFDDAIPHRKGGAMLWHGAHPQNGCIAISHVFHDRHAENWAHIAAASPGVVLALIARIRELETRLANQDGGQ